jgi:hypothetical protein
MPKKEIDYSNTIIYKITCKDLLINEIYIGHTTNFVQRKHTHKISCINEKSKNYNCKLYEVIRKNGGWDNWKMEIIDFYNCDDHYEARKIEQTFFISLKATLNSIEPLPKQKQKFANIIEDYYCKNCNFKCSTLTLLETHNLTKKHNNKNEFTGIKKIKKNAYIFYCESCDFNCSKKCEWDRHIIRPKHKKRQNDNETGKNGNEKTPQNALHKYICNCGRAYKHSSGLSRHKNTKTCSTKQLYNLKDNENSEVKILTNLVLEVVKQNQELISQNNESQKQNQELQKNFIELCKNGTTNTTITNTNNNSNNKTFNLNVFLNEHCKDAMNIMDFVDSLKLQLSDLESIGKLGFVEGISNIIIRNLKALDIHKRPVHCSDSKREVMYIKDDDKWEKENENKQKLRKAIKRIANKNSRLLPEFKAKHPDCIKSISKYSDQYNKLIVESMGGSGNEDFDNENKIIKKIAKEAVIDKILNY